MPNNSFCKNTADKKIASCPVASNKQKSRVPMKMLLCLINQATKHHAIRTCGEWKYSSSCLDFDNRWKLVVNFMPSSFYSQRNNPQCQLDRRLHGNQGRPGRCGIEKTHILLLRTEPGRPDCRIPLYLNLTQRELAERKGTLFVPVEPSHASGC
jgi:hypothetical protein